jgi:hypothetical protein
MFDTCRCSVRADVRHVPMLGARRRETREDVRREPMLGVRWREMQDDVRREPMLAVRRREMLIVSPHPLTTASPSPSSRVEKCIAIAAVPYPVAKCTAMLSSHPESYCKMQSTDCRTV